LETSRGDILIDSSSAFFLFEIHANFLGNAIGDGGAIALAATLSENNRSLRNLFLAGPRPFTYLEKGFDFHSFHFDRK